MCIKLSGASSLTRGKRNSTCRQPKRRKALSSSANIGRRRGRKNGRAKLLVVRDGESGSDVLFGFV